MSTTFHQILFNGLLVRNSEETSKNSEWIKSVLDMIIEEYNGAQEKCTNPVLATKFSDEEKEMISKLFEASEESINGDLFHGSVPWFLQSLPVSLPGHVQMTLASLMIAMSFARSMEILFHHSIANGIDFDNFFDRLKESISNRVEANCQMSLEQHLERTREAVSMMKTEVLVKAYPKHVLFAEDFENKRPKDFQGSPDEKVNAELLKNFGELNTMFNEEMTFLQTKVQIISEELKKRGVDLPKVERPKRKSSIIILR